MIGYDAIVVESFAGIVRSRALEYFRVVVDAHDFQSWVASTGSMLCYLVFATLAWVLEDEYSKFIDGGGKGRYFTRYLLTEKFNGNR